MIFLGWVVAAVMLGVLFFGCAHWYRCLLEDCREPRFRNVWTKARK